MRWWLDWLVPFLLGAVPLLALIVVIEMLGWPPALIWIGIAFAITVALLARERMHDHEAEREQRHAELARALFPYIEAELKKRER